MDDTDSPRMIDTPVPLDVLAARRRLAAVLPSSPLRSSAWLAAATGADVHLKIESVLPSHAFKIRGAFNALLRLTENGAPAQTVVTASAGNHGRAMALAGERLGVRVIVFTPHDAPDTKKQAIRRHGAVLDDSPPSYDEAERAARAYADRERALFISPYSHPDVIAGAGTIALEILEALPDVARIYVPLGGGGLASGMGLAVKAASPSTVLVGVEAAASRPFSIGFAHGRITEIDVRPSLADGLTGNLEPGAITFDLVRQYIDRIVSVSEADLHNAVRSLAAEEHLVVEGAGADSALPRGAKTVVLVTGGNLDLGRLAAIVR
jgi:threonine dehydratase